MALWWCPSAVAWVQRSASRHQSWRVEYSWCWVAALCMHTCRVAWVWRSASRHQSWPGEVLALGARIVHAQPALPSTRPGCGGLHHLTKAGQVRLTCWLPAYVLAACIPAGTECGCTVLCLKALY